MGGLLRALSKLATLPGMNYLVHTFIPLACTITGDGSFTGENVKQDKDVRNTLKNIMTDL